MLVFFLFKSSGNTLIGCCPWSLACIGVFVVTILPTIHIVTQAVGSEWQGVLLGEGVLERGLVGRWVVG